LAKKHFETRLVSFVGQKGGVGKSALARLLAVGAARRGLRVLLADFDREQLTCVAWNDVRQRAGLKPDVDARSFKSLKKLRKREASYDLIIADTRGLADELTEDVAKESDLVVLPTGTSGDDLRPTLALANRLAALGGSGKLTLVLARIGKSDRQIAQAISTIEAAGFDLLPTHWPFRDGIQSELDAGRVGLDARSAHLKKIATHLEHALFARAFPQSEQQDAQASVRA
jgi:chromosome partitioning protein